MIGARRLTDVLLVAAGLVTGLEPPAVSAAQTAGDGPWVVELEHSGCRLRVPEEALSSSSVMWGGATGFLPVADDLVVEFRAGVSHAETVGQAREETHRLELERLRTEWNDEFGETDDVVVRSPRGFSLVRNERAIEVFEFAGTWLFLDVVVVAVDRLPVGDARSRVAFARLHDAFECAETADATPARRLQLGVPFDTSFAWPGSIDSDRDEAALEHFPRPAQEENPSFTIDRAVRRVDGHLADGSTISFTLFAVSRSFDGDAERTEVRELASDGLVSASQDPRWLDRDSELLPWIAVDPRDGTRLRLRVAHLVENRLLIAEWTSEPDRDVSIATSEVLRAWIEPVMLLPTWHTEPSGRVDPVRVTGALERRRGRVERCFDGEPLTAETHIGITFDRVGNVTRTYARGDRSSGVASREAYACTIGVLRSLPLAGTFGGDGILFVACRANGCRVVR